MHKMAAEYTGQWLSAGNKKRIAASYEFLAAAISPKQSLIWEASRNHTSNSVEYILLGDIGAINARFALLSNGKLDAINSFEVAKFAQFTDLLANFLKERCRQNCLVKPLYERCRFVRSPTPKTF